MTKVNEYRTKALLANVQELTVSILEEFSGNDFASMDISDMTQDVAACIGKHVKEIKEVAV